MTEALVEILTARELAQRLNVNVSWVIDASQPARTSDPVPVMKVGRHHRYAWAARVCPHG